MNLSEGIALPRRTAVVLQQELAAIRKLDRAHSRLYRSQNLYENMRWKALAKIYTMHSFAQLLESIIDNWGKKTMAKTTQLCNLNFCQKLPACLQNSANLANFLKNFANVGKIFSDF